MKQRHSNSSATHTAFIPDLLYTGGRFRPDTALVCDEHGRIVAIAECPVELLDESKEDFSSIALPEQGLLIACRFVRLRGRALLPGLVNAHSHAFQRVIRGRTEYRTSEHSDSFWTWREMMYSAAARLSPEDLYDASRMAFLEMALSGITTVGEFHYIHRTPAGQAYSDPNLLAKEVVRAARDTGLRIALLRVAYARSGYAQPPNERQRRFIEPDADTYLRHLEDLQRHLDSEDSGQRLAWVGPAPHSVRAVPLDYLRQLVKFADERDLPVHMHVAEQPAELDACLKEYGRTPVALLAAEGLISPLFTAVHAVHITPDEAHALGAAGANVCACPTTERNLGDGIVPAGLLFKEGVHVALGTDSQAQIDLLEDARELEYHLRLSKLERAVLSPRVHPALVNFHSRETHEEDDPQTSMLAAQLFDCATRYGARSLSAPGGAIETNRPADFFTIDLQDPSIAGAGTEDLLASVVFSLSRTAVREVSIGGRLIVQDGQHSSQPEIVARFNALQKRLWR